MGNYYSTSYSQAEVKPKSIDTTETELKEVPGKRCRPSLVVASIDFGTTFCGYGFIFRHDVKTIFTDKDNERMPASVLLIKGSTKLYALGKNAGERFYEMSKEERGNYHYFKHFKMALYETKKLSRDTEIPDHAGNMVKVMTVFSEVLSHLKSNVCKHVNRVSLSESGRDIFSDKDITWTLTVPAIWSDSARQFMREAALAAGIEEDKLRLVLEPEAASLYCRSEIGVTNTGGSVSPMESGYKYIIADLGGGTVDLCAHEVLPGKKLRELYRATGEHAGGMTVNEEFYKFLNQLFGVTTIGRFKTNHHDLFLDLMENFELKKKEFWRCNTMEFVVLKLDVELTEAFQSCTGQPFSSYIKGTQFGDNISLSGAKLKIRNVLVKEFFEPSITAIIGKLTEILSACSKDAITTVLLAGGYSESPYLQHRLTEELKQIQVVVCKNASLAVINGAAMMALESENIIERRSRFTYGFAKVLPYEEGVHPEQLKFYRDGKPWCNNVFHKLVERNKVLQVGETHVLTTRAILQSDESKTSQWSCQLWRSSLNNPTYCTEYNQCEMVGLIVMTPPEEGWADTVDFSNELVVGETEFTVKVFDQSTGERYEAHIDFL